MKKSLICLSVLGLSATVHAQSSVTLQGVVDVTMIRGTGSLSNRSQLGSGANSTSKLIFRGTEDLGGGRSAFFHLESGMLADSGVFQSSTTNNQTNGTGPAQAGGQGLTFNRRAVVGLVDSWGKLHIGREWSPMYDAYTGKFDPFAVVGVGAAINYAGGITQANGAVRMSNDVAYITPKFFGGLTANIQHWFGENASGTATSDDGTGNGIRFNYDRGPVGAVLHWGRTSYAAGDTVYRAAAVAYNFGPANASVMYNSDSQGTLEKQGWLVGVRAPIGGNEVKGSYSVLTSNAAGEPGATKLALGYIYNLSKRSAIYTTFAHLTNSGGSKLALGGATTAANESSNGFDLGIRHNF